LQHDHKHSKHPDRRFLTSSPGLALAALLMAAATPPACGTASLKPDAGQQGQGGGGGTGNDGALDAPPGADATLDVPASGKDATDATTDAAQTSDAGATDTAPLDSGAPDAGACARPKTCAVLHGCSPTVTSGSYMIFPDGVSDAGLLVHCDMETANGGWTVIYLADSVNLNSTTIDYTVPAQSIRDASQEALIAFRNLNVNMVASDWASFGLPATWRAKNPLAVTAPEDITVSASVNGALPALATLRYGQANFSTMCGDPWVTTTPYGRVCLQGTAAAFFSGFTTGPMPDYCSLSDQAYSTRVCSDTVRFSIAVR
jgi:hypothetical protein